MYIQQNNDKNFSGCSTTYFGRIINKAVLRPHLGAAVAPKVEPSSHEEPSASYKIHFTKCHRGIGSLLLVMCSTDLQISLYKM